MDAGVLTGGVITLRPPVSHYERPPITLHYTPCHAGLSLCLANEMLFHLSTWDKWRQEGGEERGRLAWQQGQGSQQQQPLCFVFFPWKIPKQQHTCLSEYNTVTMLEARTLDKRGKLQQRGIVIIAFIMASVLSRFFFLWCNPCPNETKSRTKVRTQWRQNTQPKVM